MYGGSFLPFLTVILVKTKYYTKQWQIHNIRPLNNRNCGKMSVQWREWKPLSGNVFICCLDHFAAQYLILKQDLITLYYFLPLQTSSLDLMQHSKYPNRLISWTHGTISVVEFGGCFSMLTHIQLQNTVYRMTWQIIQSQVIAEYEYFTAPF